MTATDANELSLSDSTRELAGANEMFPRLIAQAYALNGDADACAAWLRKAASKGFVNYPFLAEYDPLLAAVRHHEAVKAALAEIRMAWEQIEV